MNDFLVYNFKVGIILAIFFVFYAFLLRRETFYRFNRIYLLAALFTTLIIPLLNITISPPVQPVQNNFANIEYTFQEVSQTLDLVETKALQNVNSFPVVGYLIILGMLLASIRVGVQLVSIFLNIRRYEIKTINNFKYVLLDKHQSTHSFFNYIFVQKSDFEDKRKKEVLLHEKIHAAKLHSLDNLFVGVLTILQWFNPFIYFYQRALSATHEFQADQAVVDRGVDRLQYQKLLLGQARAVVYNGLISRFNQSLIKDRFIMMNKTKSKKRVVAKYLLMIPLMLSIAIVFACTEKNIEESIKKVLSFEGGKISFQYEEGMLNYEASDSIKMEVEDGIIWLYGNARAESGDVSIESERIIITKKDRMVYAFADDNIPSLSPVNHEHLKRSATGYGLRMHPILKVRRMHTGMDFAAPDGTPIVATTDGIVKKAQRYGNWGNMIVLDHGNDFVTKYAHLSKFNVVQGQLVHQGDVIGHVGNTGLSARPHLHYEIWKSGRHVNPDSYLGVQINSKGQLDESFD